MKILLSPAKSLNLEPQTVTKKFTESSFSKEIEKVHKALVKQSPKNLMELMSISENLANLNWERNQNFDFPFTTKNAKQAIFTFNGDVYDGLDAYSIPVKNHAYLQDSVRMLSGLYGILKPFDLMQAYRLEMGTKLTIGTNKNLYEFWSKIVTGSLQKELKKDEVIVNLASQEYFKVIDKKNIENTIISPQFKDYKDGKLKIISFYAKKARGSMARFMVDNQLQKASELQQFNDDDYAFDAALSTPLQPVFTR